MFASLFPEKTNALVLEGVVYDGWDGVFSGRTLPSLIQKFYDSFKPEVKTRLNALVEENKFSPFWLPMTTKAFLMQSGNYQLSLFKDAIEEAVVRRSLDKESDVGAVFKEMASALPSPSFSAAEMERMTKWFLLRELQDPCKTLKDSDDLNQLLMIKEFNASVPNVSQMYRLRKGKIETVAGVNYSSYINKFTEIQQTPYSASLYPVSVPTFYIQGTYDGATPAPGASMHFKNSAKGPSQLLFFKKSSHMPFGLAIQLQDQADTHWKALQETFASFLSGKPITCETKSALEHQYRGVEIAIATKGFDAKIKCN